MPTLKSFGFAALLVLSVCRSAAAAEPWWHTYTPIASYTGERNVIQRTGVGAVRAVGYFSGWYGYWHVDDQKLHHHGDQAWEEAGRLGLRRIPYFDSGEVGDYAGFFTADGRMPYNGWSIPWWKQEPVTARWFGLAAFMADVPWAPFPTARHYGLPKFTAPDGSPAEDLYAVLSRRRLDGSWKYDYSSNPRIDDTLAQRTGLAGISAQQQDRAEVAGKSGWQTVRLVDVDFANPQLRDFRAAELARMIELQKPDGVHIDNHGDACVLYPQMSAFGLWSMHAFRGWMAARFTPQAMKAMGIDDLRTFDIRDYIRGKHFEGPAKQPNVFHDPRWTEDPLWNCYLVAQIEASLDYHRTVYRAGKEAARRAGIDCMIFGNTIPVFPGSGLMRGACDLSHFEWKTVGNLGPMRGTGLPPDGRVACVTRLGAAISEAGYCWPSLYVPKQFSGPGHDNLHKVLAFDCLANRGVLDYGYWYLDGYCPGTPESAGWVNRFIRAHPGRWEKRQYAADVGLVYCHWSQIAATTVVMPIVERAFNEYAGWASYLEHTRRQWEVVLSEDLSAERLKRFPVVVLPAVLTLSDRQAAELARYVAAGGRLIATGDSGTRRGPDEYLQVRRENALAGVKGRAGVRLIAERPGAGYWSGQQRPGWGQQLAKLLDFPGVAPTLETTAPPTVGIHVNLGPGVPGPVMTVDLTNHDLDAQSDRLTPAPACTVTVRLPAGLRGRKLEVTCVEPVESPAANDKPGNAAAPVAGEVDEASGTLRIQVGPFAYFRSYRIQ